jgi:endonuclease/exonuclease/phosphatase family metal-dependent hydrolase
MRTADLLFILAGLVTCSTAQAEDIRFGTWNITNLHHESGVPLRNGAVPRDDEDFERLREFAASLKLDIVALQEIGSPTALSRIFPAEDYHLMISEDYVEGSETAPAQERDIYTAFAVRKEAFPQPPEVTTIDALGIRHLTVDRDGKPQARRVRSGLVMRLEGAGEPVELMNVHLKSVCNANSLDPVYDTRRDGTVQSNRYDCRTLLAQTAILENWIEQRQQLGIGVIVLGDFNRQLNRTTGTDHMWQMLDDATPAGLDLVKAPESPDTVCWPEPHAGFFPSNIDFVVFQASLSDRIDEASIQKVGIPNADDPRYAGENNERLSDHCPVVGVLSRD